MGGGKGDKTVSVSRGRSRGPAGPASPKLLCWPQTLHFPGPAGKSPASPGVPGAQGPAALRTEGAEPRSPAPQAATTRSPPCTFGTSQRTPAKRQASEALGGWACEVLSTSGLVFVQPEPVDSRPPPGCADGQARHLGTSTPALGISPVPDPLPMLFQGFVLTAATLAAHM